VAKTDFRKRRVVRAACRVAGELGCGLPKCGRRVGVVALKRRRKHHGERFMLIRLAVKAIFDEGADRHQPERRRRNDGGEGETAEHENAQRHQTLSLSGKNTTRRDVPQNRLAPQRDAGVD